MVIKFWGAARTVTGSMHLLQLENGKKVLLDCGLYQGYDEEGLAMNNDWPCDPSEIDVMILSHAHIDHCGNIPHLVKDGFSGRIYCTHATFDLATVLLQDSAKIQEMDAINDNKRRLKDGKEPVQPLYEIKDVAPALTNFYTLPYDKWCRVEDDVEVQFRDAGHMLGSATVSLRIKEGGRTIKLGFTGDIGRAGAPILRDPVPMPVCDFLISESTYGGTVHESIPDSTGRLLGIIHETCVVQRGKLIIPAFSVGRTQSLVYAMDQMYTEGKLPRIPVIVDSPLSVNATQVFEMHPECFDEDLSDYLRSDPNPFGFNGLRYIRDAEDSKKLNSSHEPMVIISSSGMASAGRVVHHIKNNIEDPKCTILIVGYCAKGTLGERLVNGAKVVKIHGNEYQVNASVQKLNAYSGHADQVEMFEFINKSQKPDQIQGIYLVHGEENRALAFQAFLEGKGYNHVVVPFRGDTVKI